MLVPARSAGWSTLALVFTIAIAGGLVWPQSVPAQGRGPLRLAITSTSGSSIPKGLTKQLQATRFFFRGQAAMGNATSQVIWASSDKTVATVSNSPGMQGLVTAVSQNPVICPCLVQIRATSGPLRATFLITVAPPILLSIDVF